MKIANIFKRNGQQAAEVETDEEYWDRIANDPRLDDEGTYDYLAEQLPENESNWAHGWCRCDSCRKERRIYHRDVSYFYCWDGWDSMSYYECWRCVLKDKLRMYKRKLKKKMFPTEKERDLRRWERQVRKLEKQGAQRATRL